MESCLYEGIVHHERFRPVNHRFRYHLFMAYLDLEELPGLLRSGELSSASFAPSSFFRRDHFGDPRRSLPETVREVAEEAGATVDGPIRLLTQLRYFGYYFSPLNLFFCFGADGKTVQAVVAEVQNTPWLERHCYVLWPGNQEEAEPTGHYRHAKDFHVSPFMAMNLEYRWHVTAGRSNFLSRLTTPMRPRFSFVPS